MNNKARNKILSLVLTAAMVLTLLPVSASAADVSGHWSEAAVKTCRDYGVLDADSGYDPDAVITRAEFCRMINRAFNYSETEGAKEFSDVDYSGEYGNDMKIASAMGYIEGYSETFGPNDGLTREQAFTILGKIYKLEGDTEAKTKFSDDAQISDWARGYMNAMIEAGYVNGMGDGKLSPKAQITKGQGAQILVNLFGTIADNDLTADATYRNLTVRKSGVTVKNATVTGDLFVTAGVGTGDAAFENVTVKGRTLIAGGGVNSVSLSGSFNVIEIDSRTDTHVKIDKDTNVNRIYLNSSSSVTHGTVSVAYDADTGKMTFGGTIDQITLNADGTATATIGGIVYNIIPIKTENSPKTTFEIASGAVIKNMVINAPVNVTGSGTVEKMEVHTNGVVVDKSVNIKPENIKVDNGVIIIVGGKSYTGTGGNLPANTTSSSGSGSSGGSRRGGNGSTTTVSVTGVTLDKTALNLTVGDTETLAATVNPLNAANRAVTWYSSDTSVATVSRGIITAVAAGRAVITVTTSSGNKTATCAVTVSSMAVPVTGVTLDKTTLAMTVGETETLTASVVPSNATNQGITWSSSDTDVATVSGGIVTTVSAGNAVITVSTADGSKTATCSVTVNNLVNAEMPTITVQPADASYYVGDTATNLTVTANVSDGGTLSYEWYRNTENNTTSGSALGVTTDSYTPLIGTVGTTYYYVVITNTNTGVNGNQTASTTSSVAAVTVSAVTYTVTYDTNGGTGTAPTDNSTYATGATVNVLGGASLTPPTGKSFYRWNTQSDGSGTFYDPGNTFSITQNTTLYAIYTGDGLTATNPILISTATELSNIRNGLGNHYKLIADIDLSGIANWTKIGSWASQFTGSFDGDGYAIDRLTVSGSVGDDCFGLFGYIGSGAVKNLTLTDVSINAERSVSGDINVGGIAGYNEGAIENCTVSGDVNVSSDAAYAGGIAGNNAGGQIESSRSTAAVTASSTDSFTCVGGLVGQASNGGSITNSYATGDVNADARKSAYVGGLVGNLHNSSVTNSYATGDVNADSREANSYVGGLVGLNGYNSSITNSYATGDVNADANAGTANVGGLAGDIASISSITNCAALGGSMMATASGEINIGRVAGSNNGTLTNCYANSAMMVNGSVVTDAGTSPENDKNGAGVGSTAISDQSWWSTSSLIWDFTNVWQWENSYLPYLNDSHKVLITSLGMNAARMLLPQTATLTLGISGSGTAAHDGEYGDTFLIGAEVTITATPDEGNIFVEWQDENGETVSTDAEYSFEVTGDVTLLAVFELETEDTGGTDGDIPDSEPDGGTGEPNDDDSPPPVTEPPEQQELPVPEESGEPDGE